MDILLRPQMNSKNLYSVDLYLKTRTTGHRDSYIDIASSLLDARISEWPTAIFSKKPVLFLHIEESFILYTTACILRAMTRKRTAGLLFSPRAVIEQKTYKMKLKNFILRTINKLSLTHTLTLLPHFVDERLREISRDGIYDFQMWDLKENDLLRYEMLRQGTTHSSLVRAVREKASGRHTLVAIGRQDRSKGLELLAACAPHIADDFLVVVAGKISSDCSAIKKTLSNFGALVIDRDLSDSEILEAYAAADLVWACYPAWYDQASGIFGRAVQLGLPTLLRTGSFIDALAQSLDFPYMQFRGPEFRFDRATMMNHPRPKLTSVATHSMAVLLAALKPGTAQIMRDRKGNAEQ